MIYLDNAATTKPDGESLDRAMQYLKDDYYNPSALYAEGYNIQLELRRTREKLLSYVCDKEEYRLNFTSCGTEADNQAIFGAGRRGNVVTTLGEHSAVFSAVNELKQRGVEVRFASLNSDGSVNRESLLSLVDEKTSLVSVIHVGNETGAVNDINGLAKAVKGKNAYAVFHSDGVQAFGKIPYKLSKDIDLYSVSAHKIGGIKGVGALFRKKNLIIKPHIYGGGQEGGARSGTENVFGITNFGFAAEKKFAAVEVDFERISGMRSLLWERLDKELFTIISPEKIISDGKIVASPYILTVGVNGVRGETIMHEADDAGLIIGTGSACASNEKKRFSRVILACGVSESLADGILRISFSPQNTVEECAKAAEILNKIVRRRKEIVD